MSSTCFVVGRGEDVNVNVNVIASIRLTLCLAHRHTTQTVARVRVLKAQLILAHSCRSKPQPLVVFGALVIGVVLLGQCMCYIGALHMLHQSTPCRQAE